MLKIENLNWQDANGWGFQDLSLDLDYGEALILKGPNGSGKSTLLRILAGLIDSNIPKIEVSFHYIGHKLGLIENLSVLENMNILKGSSSQDDIWDLKELLSQKVRSLSKGQKQRVALSRLTLDLKPLWILDEATSGLDPEMKSLFIHHLNHHLQKGGSAILALHEDMDLNSRVSILELGA